MKTQQRNDATLGLKQVTRLAVSKSAKNTFINAFMFTDFSTYFKETAHESNEISRDIFSIQKYLHNYDHQNLLDYSAIYFSLQVHRIRRFSNSRFTYFLRPQSFLFP